MKAVFNLAYTLAEPPESYTGNSRADYIAERNFYNLTAEYNYFDYTLNGAKVVKNANAEHYFTREGTNTGLFNMNGPISEEKKAEIKAALKDSKSIIWHGFISFDDKTSCGFTTQENCVKFMNQTFGAFLERAGFNKSNIELLCSLHEDTDNRHIHFEFFEKQPLRLDKYGRASFTRRGKVKAEAIDNYLVSANMHLSEHADEYFTARDETITEMHRIRDVKARTGFVNGVSSFNSLLFNAELNALCEKLPETGRLQYNAKSMEILRPQIDRVAEVLIRSDKKVLSAHRNMLEQLARVEQEVKNLAAEGKLGYMQGGRMTAADIAFYMDDGPTRNKKMNMELVDMQKVDYFERLRNDYKARIGNVVLSMCKDNLRLKSSDERRFTSVNDKHRKIRAKWRRSCKSNLFAKTQSAIIAVCRLESANFLKTVQQHERDIEREAWEEQRNSVG